jgi:hypothetical protein
MTPPAPRRVWLVLPVLAGLFAAPRACAVRAGEKDKTRQVTLCGIIATPNSTVMDPKLATIAPQLRKLLPNYGFRLLDVKSKTLHPGQSVTCDLQAGGYTANAVLDNPSDENGKVRLECQLLWNNVPLFNSEVATPPNQLFFCDQELSNGSHLLLGVGAR